MTKPDVNTYKLASMAQAAEMLGVSRARVVQLVQRDESFPEPVYRIAGERSQLWRRIDIYNYGRANGYIKVY